MRRALTALCTATLTLTLATAPAGAADLSSEVARTGCPRGSVCLYTDRHFEGRRVRVPVSEQRPDFRALDFNDQLSSWVNASSTQYCWFTDSGHRGAAHVMLPNVRVNVLPAENDEASSLRRC